MIARKKYCNNYRHWNAYEEKILLRDFGTKDIFELSKELGRSPQALKNKYWLLKRGMKVGI